ncbi:MAG TPA: penicillin-binding protein activator LpoB [Gammaproteobacteria bacterium]|nr:penicillin-binding protein activator LpoB [Gammaproteobacteria bacterium]
MRNLLVLTSAALLLALTACATQVERVAPDTVRDLSGSWNDTDSRLVAEEMIADVLSRPWLESYVRQHGGQAPVVIVGDVRNLSHEHINTRTFISDMERALINSGRVQFVAADAVREQIRDERADQDLNASSETRNAMGQELGADFMLVGTINTIIDAEGDEAVKFYQVDLKLISMADNRIVWLGQKKIKKFVEHNSLRW